MLDTVELLKIMRPIMLPLQYFDKKPTAFGLLLSQNTGISNLPRAREIPRPVTEYFPRIKAGDLFRFSKL